VSYGTKVALEYAEAHPSAVESLVLDSVVAPERDDPFGLATFQAMKPAFAELCSKAACAGISANPLADLARLVVRVHRRALSGYVYDGSGHRRRSELSDVALLNLLAAGDLNPALRALLPASVVSALRGDSAPLLRLNLLSEGVVPNLPGGPPGVDASADGVDEALFVDTTCEEEPFPWSRAAAPATRLAEGLAALRAVPPSAFYPFDANVEWADSVLPGCAHWPNAAPSPPPPGALPDVPTLILSGAQDLRTPTSGAAGLTRRIADAQLLVVPYTGHSVLGSDFSGCAQGALRAFFSSGPVAPCSSSTPDLFAPTPITPTRLAYVKPIDGVRGLAGSTLAVTLETILDLERQIVGATLQATQQLPSGASFGGLRGGYARLSSSSLRLHRFAFVPGVALSADFPVVKGRLRPSEVHVEGTLAARGTVRIGTPVVTGTLGGSRFTIEIAKVRLASARAPTDPFAPTGAVPAAPPVAGAQLALHLPFPALDRLR
ncbi:MAG TPA: alpha/beta hydrolase, partial [Solirubrobacteraceae bacterium]|nr:alpha/beta hydrolase [Solirubrobacteraceae bacterium]